MAAFSIARSTIALVLTLTLPGSLLARTVNIPPGTAVFAETEEQVTSRIKKDGTDVGDIVRAHVWRDVTVEGAVVIKAGTTMLVRVSEVKKAKMAGIKGKIELESVSVPAVDGTQLLLNGGYDKSGHGRMGLSISLAAVVAWPLIFIHGKSAILEPGTIFDCSVMSQQVIQVEGAPAGPRTIRLGDGSSFLAAVLYDEVEPEGKSKSLPMKLEACNADFTGASVVTVNGDEVPPMPITLGASTSEGDCTTVHCEVDLKLVGKHFRKGINRFEVEGAGKRSEVVLDVEL